MSATPPPRSRFRRFWNDGGKAACVIIPAIVGFHYLWYRLQFNKEVIPDNLRKSKVIRVGPVLIDKDQNISFIKPGEYWQSHQNENKKED